jgi:signal transduction histidine kinase
MLKVKAKDETIFRQQGEIACVAVLFLTQLCCMLCQVVLHFLPLMPKILVIDDDELVRDMIVVALRQHGLEALEAADGIEGVQLAKRSHPDLVLCDLQMPKLDGYGTLAALRQDQTTAAIPFIFLTGYADQKKMRQGMNLGADDFLSKPIAVPELLAAIQTRLEKHRLTREQAERRLHTLRSNITFSLPHEIRTPLSGIIGFAEVLRDDNANLKPDEISEMASLILKSAKRLGNLTENFLSYAQLEVLASDPERVALLRTERTTMLDMHIEELSKKKGEEVKRSNDIILHLSGGEAAISTAHMRRVVEELIDNALKFSHAGTVVELISERVEDTFRLRVTDAGVGMSAEEVSELQAYRQFHRKEREQQGTGLGLAIVKRLVELYGGSLSIQSEVGKGTTVVVELPAPAL